jgi:hypothetical protein
LASYNWQNVISASSVDAKLEEFLTATSNMINDFFPTKTVKFHQNDKFFMTAKLRKMIVREIVHISKVKLLVLDSLEIG